MLLAAALVITNDICTLNPEFVMNRGEARARRYRLPLRRRNKICCVFRN